MMKRAAAFEAVVALSLIFLSTVLVIGVLDGPTDSGGNWTTSSVNATPYMYTGSDGTLYMFDEVQGGTNVYALGRDGGIEWSYEVTDPWMAINWWERSLRVTRYYEDSGWTSQTDRRPVFAVDNGTMYLYLKNSYFSTREDTADRVIAIKGGLKLWEKPITVSILTPEYRDAWIQVSDDRLYVYHSYLLEVLGTNGTLLYRIPDVSDPPAVDEKGNVYLMRAGMVPDPELSRGIQGAWDQDGRVPSDTLASYDRDGTLRWETEVDGIVCRQDIDRDAVFGGGDLPLLDAGRLYVPLENGIIALDTDGNVLWAADVRDNVTLLRTMPFGPDGTAYMERDTRYNLAGNRTPVIYKIVPGGSFTVMQPPLADADLLVASQGTGYFGRSQYGEDFMPGIDSLLPINITAVDMRTGNRLWTREIVPAVEKVVIADRQNVLRLFEYSQTAWNSIYYSEDHPELLDNAGLVFYVLGNSRVNVLASRDVIYVGYYLYDYEHPIGYWNGTT
ncbi:MAG: PQQ-binding-like beta-propeller repeat protein, partial [Methanocella sp.]